MQSALNFSAYRFVALTDLADWRRRVLARAAAAHLLGTVLLAEEGINLFLAGREPDLRAFWIWLTAQAPFVGLPATESWSASAPFRKLRVKVKAEIIRMNRPTIRPQAQRAPQVDPVTLARWLDQGADDTGRPVVTLDTRNAFEVAHGRFAGAVDWQLAMFSDFPRALAERRSELEGKTVVSYCTGGIRCEKAALLMAEAGIADVYQLDGGILKYFERVGGQHFIGNCFVFDERITLSDTLAPAEGA
ncbi:MAG: sulfurtransferase [Pseudomonadota bacterium]|nr:sulfurtransferase [Pseudomonadota bacterium]